VLRRRPREADTRGKCMRKDCRRCLHVSENIAGGTNELICAHPDRGLAGIRAN